MRKKVSEEGWNDGREERKEGVKQRDEHCRLKDRDIRLGVMGMI